MRHTAIGRSLGLVMVLVGSAVWLARPARACACTPPPSRSEVLVLALDSSIVDGVSRPADSTYDGYDVTLSSDGHWVAFQARRGTAPAFVIQYAPRAP